MIKWWKIWKILKPNFGNVSVDCYSIIIFHNLSTFVVTHSEKAERMRALTAREKLIGRVATAGLREELQGPSQEKFISAAGRTVSVIDHGEIVREDLSGRSALTAAKCNAAQADYENFLLNLTSIASLRAHVRNDYSIYFDQ